MLTLPKRSNKLNKLNSKIGIQELITELVTLESTPGYKDAVTQEDNVIPSVNGNKSWTIFVWFRTFSGNKRDKVLLDPIMTIQHSSHIYNPVPMQHIPCSTWVNIINIKLVTDSFSSYISINVLSVAMLHNQSHVCSVSLVNIWTELSWTESLISICSFTHHYCSPLLYKAH